MSQPVISAIVVLDLSGMGSRNVEILTSAKDKTHVVTKPIVQTLKEATHVHVFRDTLEMPELDATIMMSAWRTYAGQELFVIILKAVIDVAVHLVMSETHILPDVLTLTNAHTAILQFVECELTATIFLVRTSAVVR